MKILIGHIRYLLVWLLWGVIPMGLFAQNEYRTAILKVMADKTGLCQYLDSVSDGEYIQIAQFNEQPLTAIVEDKCVTHIGYSIFDSIQREGLGEHVCNFLERYLLELDIPTNEIISKTQRMKEDGFVIEKGVMDLSQLRTLCSDSTAIISLNTINEKRYTLGWRWDAAWHLILSFPIEYDLLYGTNMDEREAKIAKDLEKDYCYEDSLNLTDQDMLVKAWHDNYYTLKGDYYLLDDLSSNLYFEKDDNDKYKPIYNKTYPIESLANLLTSNLVENDYTLEIRLKKYGFKTDTISIPLRRWITYCKRTGCKPYFGVIDFDIEGTTTCELIMHNEKMGYNHIMNVTFPMAIFDEKKGCIYARLNSYVTSSRIKNLFGESNYTVQ